MPPSNDLSPDSPSVPFLQRERNESTSSNVIQTSLLVSTGPVHAGTHSRCLDTLTHLLSDHSVPGHNCSSNLEPTTELTALTNSATVPVYPCKPFTATGVCFICLDGPDDDRTPNAPLPGPISSSSSSSGSNVIVNEAIPNQNISAVTITSRSVDTKPSEKKVSKGRELVACCSQCYTVVHRRCWRDWRRNQKLSSLRARLLAQSQPNVLACSVCKTGIAGLLGESAHVFPNAAEYNNESSEAAARERIQNELFQIIGRMLSDGDDDDEEEPPCCTVPVAITNMILLMFVIGIDAILVWSFGYYAGDVILWSLLAAYLLSTIQLLILAIVQRRQALGPFINRPTNDNATNSNSTTNNAYVSTDLSQLSPV